jgi:BlaI family transcriptional regulator, penicillinase repressor
VPARPKPSAAELDIARVLWTLGRATVRQVHEALPARLSLEFPTVQTYLRRLEVKGYAVSELDGRTRVYRPAVKGRDVVRRTVDDLLQKLFDGEALPLVRHLVERKRVTRLQLDELRKLIDEAEESLDD